MIFNYRYAEAKNQLEFLAMWMALEKDFIPLFKNLREIGGKDFIDGIYKLVYTGNIADLNRMISPQQIANLKIPQNQVDGYISSINSIISIMQQTNNQPILQQLLGLINTKDKEKKATLLKNLTTNLSEDLSTYFSEELLKEIKSNSGLIPVLMSGRVGMGAQMGMPETRLTVDQLGSKMDSAFANDMSFATNFMNMLSTLLHRSTISRKTLNMLMPDLGEDVQITPQQDFTFCTMCESGADPDSKKAQYDVIKWIESTEKITADIEFDDKLPKFKELDMIKRAADLVGEEGFAAQGYSYADFYQSYEELKNSNNKIKEIQSILLGKIPPVYHYLFTTAVEVSKLSPEEQEAYKQRFPKIGEVVDAESTDTDNGLKIRTMQLLMVKNAATQAWGTHIKRFAEATQQVFPSINNDKFVQLMFLEDDIPIREELIAEAQKSKIDVSPIIQSENEHEMVAFRDTLNIDNSKKSNNLLIAINRLIKAVRLRNNFINNADIADIPMFKEILAQKTQMLDMSNLLGNIPGIARLWSVPTMMAGRHIIDPAYAGEITRSDIIKSAGFNPLAANYNFKDAVQIKTGEALEDYKNRMASLVRGLIDQGHLYPGEGSNESPLSHALKTNPNRANPTFQAVNTILNFIIRAEQNLEQDDDLNDDDVVSETPNEDITDIETASRIDRKRVLEDLLDREGLTSEDIGNLNINLKWSQYHPDTDPELAEIGLGTDSALSAKVVEIFRGHFNLPICTYALEINSPQECKVNLNGFKMDFTIMADKLATNPDGTLGMQSHLILAGEAFGYQKYTGRPLIVDNDRLPEDKEGRDKQKKRNARMLQNYSEDITSADGQWRIYRSEDGNGLMADFPYKNSRGEESTRTEKADRYVEYTIRSSYKEPYETFLATVLGADTLFIPPFNPKNPDDVSRTVMSLAKQLDSLSIIWRSDSGESKAYKIIASNATELGPEFAKYTGEKPVVPYTNSELYARSLLAHYDLQNIVIPFYLANQSMFKLETMVAYQQRYKALGEQLASLAPADVNSRTRILAQMNDLKRTFQMIVSKYEEFLNGEPSDDYHRMTINNRNQILAIAQQAAGMKAVDVHNRVVGKNALFHRKSVVNSVDYHQFPASVYSKVASSLRWWK